MERTGTADTSAGIQDAAVSKRADKKVNLFMM